jgi:hypothetical protein
MEHAIRSYHRISRGVDSGSGISDRVNDSKSVGRTGDQLRIK